jgi:hypothetical protein
MSFSAEFVRNTSAFSNQASTVLHGYSSSNNVLGEFVGVVLLEEDETRRQATRHLTPYSFVQKESTEPTPDEVGSIRPLGASSTYSNMSKLNPTQVSHSVSINNYIQHRYGKQNIVNYDVTRNGPVNDSTWTAVAYGECASVVYYN